MEAATPIRIHPADKLLLLRRLDRERTWESLDDRRYCLCCQMIINGRQLDVAGGTRPFGPLRLLCPTEDCPSTPRDWIYPDEKKIWAPSSLRDGTDKPHHAKAKTTLPKIAGRVIRVQRKRFQSRDGSSDLGDSGSSGSATGRKFMDLFRNLSGAA